MTLFVASSAYAQAPQENNKPGQDAAGLELVLPMPGKQLDALGLCGVPAVEDRIVMPQLLGELHFIRWSHMPADISWGCFVGVVV